MEISNNKITIQPDEVSVPTKKFKVRCTHCSHETVFADNGTYYPRIRRGIQVACSCPECERPFDAVIGDEIK